MSDAWMVSRTSGHQHPGTLRPFIESIHLGQLIAEAFFAGAKRRPWHQLTSMRLCRTNENQASVGGNERRQQATVFPCRRPITTHPCICLLFASN